jgi:hypothetical protein
VEPGWGHRAFAALLAVLAPLMVLGAGYTLLLGYEDADDAMAARNAGRVLNAKVLEGDAAQVMDHLLAQNDPRVLIIGPSYANTNVRPTQLAAALDLHPSDALMLSVPNSVGAHWYSILKYRVFESGYQPDLVVIVSGLQSMLLTTPLTESSYVNLRVQLPHEGDALVRQKVRGSAGLLWARLREQRGKLREALFAAVRYRPIAWFVRDGTGRMYPNEARVALDKVFDDSRIDMSLHRSSIPIVEASRVGERYYTPEMLPTPQESFLGDISRLAAEHGARVVWVRPPMSPHIPEHLDDVVLPGVQEDATALVESLGASFVDMRGLPMSSAMFKNEDHMNEEGSRRFTAALVQALRDLDALSPLERPPALAPLQASVAVEGPTELPAALAALPGGGRWIGPGGRVRYRFDTGWDGIRGPFQVAIVAEGVGEVDPPAVTVGRQPLVGFSRQVAADRVVLRASDEPSAPDGPFGVEVVNPADAGWVRVRSLALGHRLGRTFLEGDEAAADGRRVDLLAGAAPEFPRPPGHVPAGNRPVTDLPGPIAAFETAAWPFLSDEALQGETSFRTRCSPLRITEDGALLPNANVPCLEVKREGRGSSCHTTERIFFTASDDSDPATNGRAYRLVLDDGRRCADAIWLYPEDSFRVVFPAERLAELPAGASWLTLSLKYLQYREAFVQVRLLVDGRPVIDQRLASRELRADPQRAFRIEPPLPPGATDVVLEVDNLDLTFHLVTEVALSELPPT